MVLYLIQRIPNPNIILLKYLIKKLISITLSLLELFIHVCDPVQIFVSKMMNRIVEYVIKQTGILFSRNGIGFYELNKDDTEIQEL